MASEPAEAGFQRQHPLSWIFQTLAVIRSAVLPAVLFLVFSQGFAFGWLAALLALPALAVGVARHLALGYSMGSEELIVRDGILSRNERRIRYSRIQNLDEIQGPLHRILGVIAVRIETASGGKPEAVLNLSAAAVEELRQTIFELAPGEDVADPEVSSPPLLEVPLSELVRLGLIRNRGMVVLAAVLGVAFQGGSDFASGWWERVGSWIYRFGNSFEAGEAAVPELGAATWAVAALAFFATAYLLLSALSVTLSVVRYAGFTLGQRGDDLTARYGLLSRLRVTVPKRRIQRIQVDESLLHRIWRRISVRLDTAGGRSTASDSPWAWQDDQGPTRGRQWLAPVTTSSRLEGLLAAALPGTSRQPLAHPFEETKEGEAGWQPVARRAAHRLFNRWSLVVLAVTFALVWLSRWSLLLPLPALPLVWWLCRRTIAARFYWATADALWWRSGWPGRRLVVVPFDKIQSVVLGETPFDRRHAMARIVVDTAGSGILHAARITYLDAAAASELAQRLSREAERREFVWS